MSPKIVDKEAKRQEILHAAISIFARKGFLKTTINDIAVEAQIGKGTIYEYFPTKEDLIHQSFSFYINSLTHDFEPILLKEVSAREKLKEIFEVFSSFINHSPDVLELMVDFWAEGMKGHSSKGLILEDMRIFYQLYRSIFSKLLADGVADGSFRSDIDTEALAGILVGTLDGILVQWFLDRESLSYNIMVTSFADAILNGIVPNNI